MADTDEADAGRRDFLTTTTTIIGAAGAAAACWPFVVSMNPTPGVRAQGAASLPLDGIPPGAIRTVAWRGKPVFVFHRVPEQIAKADSSQGGKDPQPDAERVQDAAWLVVVGLCTHLGCVPNKTADGWLCPCHGSVYDNSGRILSGPAPRNLDIPPYTISADGTLMIG